MKTSVVMRCRALASKPLARLGRFCTEFAARLDRDERTPGERETASLTDGQSKSDLDNSVLLLEALLEACPDKVYFKDRQSRFVRYSRSFAGYFKLSDPGALRGKTDFDFFTEEHARPAFEDEQQIIKTGQPIIGKFEKETLPDGRVTWALTSKLPWYNAAREIIGIFGISKDVTNLKEMEQKLARERELLRTLLDNVPDCIYFKDRQSRFVHYSRSFSRLFQVDDPETIRGKTDFDYFTEEHARPAFEDEQRILQTDQPLIGKLEKETYPDGRVTWALTTKMPWHNSAGEIIGTFGISRDITALKKAEADLEAAHKRLVEASRMAGMAEVATDVLHNVGNTLNSINVSCSLAIDRLKQCQLPNLDRIPELLRQHAGHLDEFLTSDPQGKHIPDYLLTLVRTFEEQKAFLARELNQLQLHVEHVNQIVAMQQDYAQVAGIQENVEITQLVEDALRINAAALDRHSVTIVRQLEPVGAILVDKHKVLQILVNLIRNAKYAVSETGREDKIVTLRTCRTGSSQIGIQVIDNGVGIAPENLTRIFAHGFTTRRNGHGFGLHSGALAARELGGSLSAQSAGVGQGAVFTLTLPLNSAQSQTFQTAHMSAITPQ